MKRETLIWTIVLLAGLIGLSVRAATTRMGRVYTQTESRGSIRPETPGAPWTPATPLYDEQNRLTGWAPESPDVTWQVERTVPANRSAIPGVHFSTSRTLVVWIAAAMTLCALSFLWGDNVFFKIMQAIIVGVSAGYAFVVYVWSKIVPDLLGKLYPPLAAPFVPGVAGNKPDWLMLIPLVLSLMLLCRLLPGGRWISRWPMAFFIGLLAGVNLVNIFQSDFVEQVSSTIVPLLVFADGRIDVAQSLRNAGIVLGVVSTLAYFYFSAEHRGGFGVVARIGIWVLMITFGASFGLTVMTRITVFSERLGFLINDWLWLTDVRSEHF